MTFANPSAPHVVLVVEDEPLLRIHATVMLEDAGFAVLEAADADEALDILGTRADVRVVFTDINMPGAMDGLRLADVIRHRWPPIEIVITSGQVMPLVRDIPARGLFLRKPYNGDALVGAVRSLSH